MSQNIILLTDSYKVSHHVQYPPKTTKIVSYFECRGGRHKDICFFGLQYLVKKHLIGVVVTAQKIAEAKDFYQRHFGPNHNIFNEAGWKYILDTHKGRLPVRIKAVPEGTCLPYKNACMTVENTDPNCFWLVNFLETLLVQVWYPTTVATNSREQKKTLLHCLHKSGDVSGIDFKLHDAAHLTQFLGTDTIPGLVLAREYYGAECAGFSIPASEHSTITSWGKTTDENSSGGETAAIRNMLNQYPKGMVACVSDSYNIWDAITEIYGKELKQEILSRDGTLVIRPDSGPPALIDECLLSKLGDTFGFTMNSKGYKVLPPQVRIIQGDGIDFEALQVICGLLMDRKWSIDNIAFGSGGGLLQKVNRDTQNCAFKCSYAIIDGKEQAVFKDPIHSASGKKSKAGRMTVNIRNGTIVTLCGDKRDETDNLLETIFENGELVRDFTWQEIKDNAAITMDTYKDWGPTVESNINSKFEKYKTSSKYAQQVIEMIQAESCYNAPY